MGIFLSNILYTIDADGKMHLMFYRQIKKIKNYPVNFFHTIASRTFKNQLMGVMKITLCPTKRRLKVNDYATTPYLLFRQIFTSNFVSETRFSGTHQLHS